MVLKNRKGQLTEDQKRNQLWGKVIEERGKWGNAGHGSKDHQIYERILRGQKMKRGKWAHKKR